MLTKLEDGFYTEVETTTPAGPKQKQRVIKKIPQKVMQNAVGLAIFTTMRTGLWVSGAGGSGVLVARNEDDGSWSPPSGILLHTAGLGFLVGVDIYDCVLVINNRKALKAFTKIRATLGGEISAVAGPVGAGGVLENDGKWKEANRPVFTYLKSRGFYAGVQVDGTIIIERSDENKRFYGEPVGVDDILAGRVRHRPPELKMLMETLKAAEGRSDVDSELMEELEGQPAPGDVDIEEPGAVFGVPDPEDPDPYGVLALEKEGLEIRDAATRSRPPSQLFSFNPSPSSPVYNTFHFPHRRSTSLTNGSNRISRLSLDRRPYTTSDVSTQTDAVLVLPLPESERLPEIGGDEGPGVSSSSSSSSSTRRGLALEPPNEADETKSVYEDVPDVPVVDKEKRVTDEEVANPWDEAGEKSSSPYDDKTEHDGIDAKADEGGKSATAAKGPPPALPPRANTASTFEEVNLQEGKEK